MALTMSSPLTFHVTLGLSFSTSGPGEMKPTDKWFLMRALTLVFKC